LLLYNEKFNTLKPCAAIIHCRHFVWTT